MEVAATGIEKMYPVMKSIVQAALKSGITQDAYNSYIDSRGIGERNTEEVLENNER